MVLICRYYFIKSFTKACFIVVDTLGPKLSPLEVAHTEQVTELNDLTKQVSQFMERYNGTVSLYSKIKHIRIDGSSRVFSPRSIPYLKFLYLGITS
jgi:hypothetical protein